MNPDIILKTMREEAEAIHKARPGSKNKRYHIDRLHGMIDLARATDALSENLINEFTFIFLLD